MTSLTSVLTDFRNHALKMTLFIATEVKRRFWACTDSTKINRPVYSIRMYWTNFWQPTVRVQQNIFERTLLAPFNSKLVNYSRHSESLKYVWKSTNIYCCPWLLYFFSFFRTCLSHYLAVMIKNLVFLSFNDLNNLISD